MIRSELKRIVGPVEARLQDFLFEAGNRPLPGLFNTTPDSSLLEQVRDLTLRGGKRIRSALLIQGACLFDSDADQSQAVIDAAAALELFHTYLLIHDDIMDNDDLRRGGMSVHAALGKETGSREAGIGLGILAGDLAAALAQVLLTSLDVPGHRSIRANKIFAHMHLDVVHGQTLDMSGDSCALEIATRKTASYTTVGPLTMGAALGGATDAQIVRLAELATPLGIAFQFADDLLGTFGKTDVTGKPTDTDLKAGKRTVLLEEGLKRADQNQRTAIELVLGKEDASSEDIELAKLALKECGALNACKTRVRELIEKFRSGIEENEYPSHSKDFLLDLAKFIEERDK